ncbi:uncharacterized protein TNCV_697711 [Trichonephila clavipes]|nr:uncharacterized protein TNCV_697711 [Trichonephila clavipes]
MKCRSSDIEIYPATGKNFKRDRNFGVSNYKMPRLRGRASNIGRRIQHAQLVHDRRLNRTAEEHSTDNDLTECRDIRMQRRYNTVQIIQDNHRSYDALLYPLIFWEGEDEHHLNIKQRNPTIGKEQIKKVSAMNYAYRLMIRANDSPMPTVHCQYVCENRK